MIDSIASLPQYAAHLDPVWDALSVEVRGQRLRPGQPRVSDAVLVAGFQDLQRARKAGYPRIALLEHGIGQSYGDIRNASYPGGRHREAVGLFLSPNEHAAGRDRAAYPAARVEVVGDPRLDTLPALEAAPGTVAISFHWDCYVAPETRSAFPHYRDVIADLAAAVPLIAHAHPKAPEMERFYRRLGIEFVRDFDEVCRRASVFVADNTSCLYEFASTGRPVVVLNAPWFRREREVGLRFWAAAGVGLNVGSPADLVSGVQAALIDTEGQRRDRERALSIVYAYRSGAAQRAATVIEDWITSDRAVAA